MSTPIHPPGFLYDYTGSYKATFVLSAILLTFSNGCYCTVVFLRSTRGNTNRPAGEEIFVRTVSSNERSDENAVEKNFEDTKTYKKTEKETAKLINKITEKLKSEDTNKEKVKDADKKT